MKWIRQPVMWTYNRVCCSNP